MALYNKTLCFFVQIATQLPKDFCTTDALATYPFPPVVSGPPETMATMMAISFPWISGAEMHFLTPCYTSLKWQLLITCWALLEMETLIGPECMTLYTQLPIMPWKQHPTRAPT